MFKTWIDAVRKGNEYRRAKYGPPETMAESYARARRQVAWEREHIKPKTKFYWPWDARCAEIDKHTEVFKSQFAFWDEWTGGRYQRVQNPDLSNVKDLYSVCRSNPITGEWEKL
jgi:hypothetical protein